MSNILEQDDNQQLVEDTEEQTTEGINCCTKL